MKICGFEVKKRCCCWSFLRMEQSHIPGVNIKHRYYDTWDHLMIILGSNSGIVLNRSFVSWREIEEVSWLWGRSYSHRWHWGSFTRSQMDKSCREDGLYEFVIPTIVMFSIIDIQSLAQWFSKLSNKVIFLEKKFFLSTSTCPFSPFYVPNIGVLRLTGDRNI